MIRTILKKLQTNFPAMRTTGLKILIFRLDSNKLKPASSLKFANFNGVYSSKVSYVELKRSKLQKLQKKN